LLMENISAALFVLMILFMPLMCTWLISSMWISSCRQMNST
jgi:hypothetical protein